MIKVLIADDYPPVREVLSTYFAYYTTNLQVVGEANNGEEALSLVDKLDPDVVLMDISMPIMDGLKATQMLRQKKKELVIITFTSHQDASFNQLAHEAGANAHITKPFNLEALQETILKYAS